MYGYNLSIHHFEHLYPASTIYAVFYALYIPIGHFLGCIFVFGWPENYIGNLASNAPVGLSAMAVGTILTGFLSRMEFDAMVEDWMGQMRGKLDDGEKEESEFYASLVVMVVTGVWTYLLCMYVNSTEESPTTKQTVASPYYKDPEKEL
jgi:hypothetical protein